MKKSLAFLLALSLCLSLTACGSTGDNERTTIQITTAPAIDPNMNYSAPFADLPSRDEYFASEHYVDRGEYFVLSDDAPPKKTDNVTCEFTRNGYDLVLYDGERICCRLGSTNDTVLIYTISEPIDTGEDPRMYIYEDFMLYLSDGDIYRFYFGDGSSECIFQCPEDDRIVAFGAITNQTIDYRLKSQDDKGMDSNEVWYDRNVHILNTVTGESYLYENQSDMLDPEAYVIP